MENKPQIIRKREVTSSNDFVRQQDNLPEGSIVWAEEQTAGRGQAGSVWFSDTGKNLTFSLVVYPDMPSGEAQFLLSQIAALSVKEALDGYISDITVKWPNDIYHRNTKVAGILIEHDLSAGVLERSIIGIGINVNQETFPAHIPFPASLWQITGKPVEREEVLERFRVSFAHFYQTFRQGNISALRAAYREALYRNEGFHPFRDADGEFEASIDGIEPSGHLRLIRHDGTVRRYGFREVHFLNKEYAHNA